MEWIKIEDRLPYAYEYVLVCGYTGTEEPSPISIARQYKGNWEMMSDENQSNAVAKGDLTWGMDGYEITHWMPLPELPKD